MSTDIPAARALLKQALLSHDVGQVHGLIEEALGMMTRSQNQADRGARIQRKKIDAAMVIAVKRSLKENTNTPFEEIGRWHGLAGGRVSEIANGLRDREGRMIRS